MNSSPLVRYPIAEIFESVSGEGKFQGTPTSFIRFAGCSVGKPYTKEERTSLNLESYQEKCHDWTGTSFACDTNYKIEGHFSADALFSEVKSTRVCCTGGEPLLHNLEPLFFLLHTCHDIAIETSGTIDFSQELIDKYKIWVAVSPKKNYLMSMLEKSSELKILVGEDFNEKLFVEQFEPYLSKVFLQPINGENTISKANLQTCVKIRDRFPICGLSLQLHKIAGLR